MIVHCFFFWNIRRLFVLFWYRPVGVLIATGPLAAESIKIGQNFGDFWPFPDAKAATFGGKAFHRKLAIFVNFNFHYWRTVESCRTYHFFQVDWTKIWYIFAISTNQKFSNERVHQIQKVMWHLKAHKSWLIWVQMEFCNNVLIMRH